MPRIDAKLAMQFVRSKRPRNLLVAANKEESQSPIIRVLCEVEQFPLRFSSKVSLAANGCWIWTSSKSGPPNFPEHAYGRYWPSTNPRFCQIAHRFAYEFIYGPIPKGLEIDHTCHNKLCVNPAHLELVTHQENCKRRPRSGSKPGFTFQIIDGKRRKVVA